MKIIKTYAILVLFVLFTTGCSIVNKNIIDISTDFESLVDEMVEKQAIKLKKNIAIDDVVLVSDFVNLDNLQNHSKLGFLLSDSLKNSLSSRDIIIRQVELGKDFKLGKHGFNVLSRNADEIYNSVQYERYALVGTYSVTTKRLILFTKLIEVGTGNILSSSTSSVIIDKEILELERTPKAGQDSQHGVYTPLVL